MIGISYIKDQLKMHDHILIGIDNNYNYYNYINYYFLKESCVDNEVTSEIDAIHVYNNQLDNPISYNAPRILINHRMINDRLHYVTSTKITDDNTIIVAHFGCITSPYYHHVGSHQYIEMVSDEVNNLLYITLKCQN